MREREVKSYKWGSLKNSPPKNAVLYVLNVQKGGVEAFITDDLGNPIPLITKGSTSGNIGDIDIRDYVEVGPDNIVNVRNNKIYVKKMYPGDDFITIEETNNRYVIKLNDDKLELVDNKQNDLTPDGTGTKYPTVDAVNSKIQELEENINNVSGDKTFVYEQTTPSKIWEYEHGLGKRPSVQVTDSAGTVLMGKITVNDGVRVRIEFNIALWGYAINN